MYIHDFFIGRYMDQPSNGSDSRTFGSIAISMISNESDSFWRAMRNAQLARTYLADWWFQIYTLSPICNNYSKVPERVVASLQDLNGEIIEVDSCEVNSDLLPLLSLENFSMSVLLLGDSVLRDIDFKSIEEWVASPYHALDISSNSSSIFCLKSLPTQNILGVSVQNLLTQADILDQSAYRGSTIELLKEVMFPFTKMKKE
jgi:hypothetical protein